MILNSDLKIEFNANDSSNQFQNPVAPGSEILQMSVSGTRQRVLKRLVVCETDDRRPAFDFVVHV